MAYINTILPLQAPFSYDQSEMAEWMLRGFDGVKKRKYKWLLSHAGIVSRQSILPDFAGRNGKVILYSGNTTGIEERMRLFGRLALDWIDQNQNAFWESSGTEKGEITHLITVSCTGLSAPGLDYKMQQLLGLNLDLCRLSVNFMGCYAAFHALKMAHWICTASPSAKVLIVNIELCSLHYQMGESLDQVLANGLFADGAAFVLVSNDKTGFEMKRFFQRTAAQSEDEMAWGLGPAEFKMKLSAYVPQVIQSGIADFVGQHIEEKIDHYAVHPGGLKILEAFQRALALEKERLAESHAILSRYGNMSSVSIFYVLAQIVKSKSGTVCCTAFGPGLSFEGALLEL